jgi:hypothetical protein
MPKTTKMAYKQAHLPIALQRTPAIARAVLHLENSLRVLTSVSGRSHRPTGTI